MRARYMVNRLRNGIAAFFSGIPLVLYPQPALAELSPQVIFARVSQNVLLVETIDRDGTAIKQGSGVAIGSGTVITNCHVLESGMAIRIRLGNATWPAYLVYSDPVRDLCQIGSNELDVPSLDFHESEIA